MNVSVKSRRYRAVIVSPHLDDAVFSCGGKIAQMVTEGPVLVLNLFTRYLSDVKIRGVVLSEERYQEEANASSFLGFESRNLGELDVSFRRDAYKKLGNIFRPPVAADLEWLPELRQKVWAVLEDLEFEEIYVPLGIGWHVDHVLTHMLFDCWVRPEKILYYEDAPYCCIPHSVRYRLNELAQYPCEPGDCSLASSNEFRAWRDVTTGYSETALMKNLKPWIVRQFAVPVVGYYFFGLMRRSRESWQKKSAVHLVPHVIAIANHFPIKVDGMALYSSQFQEFFASRNDCETMILSYANQFQSGAGASERYWSQTPESP